MLRLGDALPSQMLDVRVTAQLHTWRERTTAEGEALPTEALDLPLSPSRGALLLRFPALLAHELGGDSPLRGWAEGGAQGVLADADAEIVVVARARLCFLGGEGSMSLHRSLRRCARQLRLRPDCWHPARAPRCHAAPPWRAATAVERKPFCSDAAL